MYFLIRKLTSFEDLAYGPKPWGVQKKISACQLALHGSRELVDMIYFCRRLAYISRRAKKIFSLALARPLFLYD